MEGTRRLILAGGMMAALAAIGLLVWAPVTVQLFGTVFTTEPEPSLVKVATEQGALAAAILGAGVVLTATGLRRRTGRALRALMGLSGLLTLAAAFAMGVAVAIPVAFLRQMALAASPDAAPGPSLVVQAQGWMQASTSLLVTAQVLVLLTAFLPAVTLPARGAGTRRRLATQGLAILSGAGIAAAFIAIWAWPGRSLIALLSDGGAPTPAELGGGLLATARLLQGATVALVGLGVASVLAALLPAPPAAGTAPAR